MASPAFEVDDQTDEDFFDKLVKDEIDFIGSVPSFVDNEDLDEARAFSNLSVTEVGPTGVESGGSNASFMVEGEKGPEDGAVSAPLDAQVDNSVGKKSDSSIPSSVSESSEMGLGEESALGSTMVKNNVAEGTGVKEVQWSSFNSKSHSHSGSRLGSYSDFLNELEDNSGDPFANVDNLGAESNDKDGGLENPVAELGSSSYGQHKEGQHYGVGTEHNVDEQDLSSSQYWENLYPGWKYDANTGQWHQLANYNANASTNANLDANVNAQSVNVGAASDQISNVYYLQQTAQSVAGSVAEGCTTGNARNLNQLSPGNVEYPAHMVFDPQYPGWYYDTIAQEWQTLESYTSAMNQSDHNQEYRSKNVENHGSQGLGSQDHVASWGVSLSNSNQQNTNMWQTQHVAKSEAIGFNENQHLGNLYSSIGHANSSPDQLASGSVALNEQESRSFDCSNGVVGFQSFVPADNFSQHHNQIKMEASQHMHFSSSQFDSQRSVNFSEQPLQSGTQISYAGRPPHALITFGFGGKLIVMKDNRSFHTNSAYGSQEPVGGVVSVLNLMEVVMHKTDASSFGLGTCDYFHTLCQQSFPGPLVGGNVGSKEVNKWIDDKIANCESPYMDYRKREVFRLLFSLLKIGCQYYGKLRSPFGTDPALKESDCPESAVVKHFASAKSTSEYGALTCCLQNLPSEGQVQATALGVQKLLVSGRKKEALDCALEGQLWGPALVLASQLGDQFYGDTVKQMALKQLVAGSPLRTLCLLIAGQPADVFSNTTTSRTLPGSLNISQQPVQIGANSLLDEWKENLAIITANRTKDDELVIIHLGDCLWKERGEITAAHICYLVAEANFESYSNSARLCLIGADHWKFPRTYASPEAIQRTELYEYSKVLGNSQFLLLPFQPYKLLYAYMLAEVGKVADSLKYCQAILKSLKTGRASEVDTWKQLASSLEERIRTHQQGGFGTNLAPTKLVGKLLTFFDSTANHVGGGLPPPIPSTSHSSAKCHEHANQPGGPRVSNSESTMAMPSLIPSASMEPISEWVAEGNRLTMPNRSISEPDFGRGPRKVDSSKETNEASVSGGSSRFGRFGSQLFQKTVGLVLRSRPDRQAKLGEKNKFYYDEKLKRWVEEGAEPPAVESALPPPPPTTAAFGNRMPDHNIKDAPRIENFHTYGGPEIQSPISSEPSSGIPPIPPSSNQFSARGRMGVRSRYVDTFNKGGGTPANLFQSPSIPAAKPGGGSNPKFFIPTPTAPSEETVQPTGESNQEAVLTANNNPSTSFRNDLFSTLQTSTSSSMTLQRSPSMDNIVHKRMGAKESSLSCHSRRAASWSGSLGDACNPTMTNEVKPLGEALGMVSSSYMPSEPPMQFSMNSNNSADDLHEVDL